MILVRPTTELTTFTAKAVVTEIGGVTSHAALVCRELNRVCVVGCGVGSISQLKGRYVTVDGTGGEILDGVLYVEHSVQGHRPALRILTRWLDDTGDDVRYRPLRAVLAEQIGS